MQSKRFDWRWVAVILVAALIANTRFLPWPVTVLVLAASGGYLVFAGWQVWNRQVGEGSARVTYWRGQRIELDKTVGRRIPPWSSIAPALVYFLLGAAMLLGGIALLVRRITG